MACIASAATARLSTRLACRQLQRMARGFSSTRGGAAAQPFTMPAMSPTMTEGNIASWKVKEGDSFAAGDVLLEIETDKAQMDVEAQEDGKVAKILVQDGSKGVKVGMRIAVFAEESDDLDTLEIPKEEENQAASPKKSEEPEHKKSEFKESSPKESKPSSSSTESKPSSQDSNVKHPAATESSSSKPQAQKYPLYPSVQMLLHSNGLSTSDANNIPATGPNGRLLKGDVLAYLGKLSEKNYPEAQAKRIEQLGHLDLSNIKKAAPKPAAGPKKEETAAAAAAAAAAVEEPDTQITVPISLAAVFTTQKRIQDSLGLHLPLSTFIARASQLANEDLPRGRSTPPTSAELFDAVLGLDKVKKQTSRGNYVPQVVTVLPTPGVAANLSAAAAGSRRKKLDVIDFLAGKKAPVGEGSVSSGAGASMSGGASRAFSVSVRKGDEKRAQVYLERVKTVLEQEPGELVL